MIRPVIWILSLLITTAAGLMIPCSTLADTRILETSYKTYSVYTHNDIDVLCEPYQVQKGEWVYKIFRKKGELADLDFSLFMAIFKKLNPKVTDPDNIHPGQRIIIPLKKISARDFKEGSERRVIVPMLQLSRLPDKMDPFVKSHTVRNGEQIQDLMDPFFLDKDGSLSDRGDFALKLANPELKQFTPLKPGTRLLLPQPEMCSQPWFPRRFQTTGLAAKRRLPASDRAMDSPTDSAYPKQPPAASASSTPARQVVQAGFNGTDSPVLPPGVQVRQYADRVGGHLMNTGTYHFPATATRKGVTLDLSQTPVITLEDNRRIIVFPGGRKDPDLIQTLKQFWQNLTAVDMRLIGKELGMARAAELNLSTLPADRSMAVQLLLKAADLTLVDEEIIRVNMSGISIPIPVRRVLQDTGPDLLLVFGTVYGNALELLARDGHEILPISFRDQDIPLAQKLFSRLNRPTAENPVFEDRNAGRSISLTGLFVGGRKPLFLSDRPLGTGARRFLEENGVALFLANAAIAQ